MRTDLASHGSPRAGYASSFCGRLLRYAYRRVTRRQAESGVNCRYDGRSQRFVCRGRE